MNLTNNQNLFKLKKTVLNNMLKPYDLWSLIGIFIIFIGTSKIIWLWPMILIGCGILIIICVREYIPSGFDPTNALNLRMFIILQLGILLKNYPLMTTSFATFFLILTIERDFLEKHGKKTQMKPVPIDKKEPTIPEFILFLILLASLIGEIFLCVDLSNFNISISNTLSNVIRIMCSSYILFILLILFIKEHYFKKSYSIT